MVPTSRATLARLTIVGGDRERRACPRRGRWKTVCARGAWCARLGGPSTSPLDGAMTQDQQVPGSTPLGNASDRPRQYSTLSVLLNVFALLLYLIALAAPLTPSHGFPSAWVLLVFAGGPMALIWAAARLWRDARTFFYGEILVLAGFTGYWLVFVGGPFR